MIMNKNKLQYILLCSVLLIIGCTNEAEQIYKIQTKKSFQNVVQDSEFAITENNFRIINRLHIGNAIQERGNTDFPRNEILLFCNLTLAEEMLRIAPAYINYCPYKITITDSNDFVTVGTRLIPSRTTNPKMDEISKNINKILHSMIEYAASEDPFILEQN